MVNEVTKVATPSGGLYPAEWLAAEAERLEREHDAIERATARLGEWIQTLTGEASALNDEHMRLLEEVDRVVARKRAHVKRVEAEYSEPFNFLMGRSFLNDQAKADLLCEADLYDASKAVEGVVRYHERRRKKEARLRRAQRGTQRGGSG
jgi:hypothetical protein